MAETGPAAIVAALTRAIADDGRGGGATLGGVRGSHARRSKRGISGGAGCGGGGGARGQATAVGASGAAAEDARGYDAAALSFPEEASRPRAASGRVTYSRVVLAEDRSRTGMARKISVRRRRREHGVLVGSWTSTSAAVAVRDAPGRARLTPLLRGIYGLNFCPHGRLT
uniref:Uncharacterized protein n=1 Tax=Oryza glaberrima TaxID=4538 RepID=I1P151_ORYGL